MHVVETVFETITVTAITLLEFMGVFIIIQASVQSFVGYLRHRSNLRVTFAHSLATALEFKLAGEILRTVIVREWSELALVGALILLRAAIAFLINWEIKNELRYEPKGDNKH